MIIFKKLLIHPRKHVVGAGQKAIIIGGTGATGRHLLNQLLESDNWDKVTSIGRRAVMDGKKNNKFKDIVVDSLHDLSSTYENWKGHDVFFNCIGTTRKRAGGSEEFVDIEVKISNMAAKMAEKARIPHASVISASGANQNQWAKDWIHPLLYFKTIGQKEQTVITNSRFRRVSIFRPGMLIRLKGNQSWLEGLFESRGFGLRVDILASAMIRDAESSKVTSEKESPIVYLGNDCIKDSIKL